MFQKKILQKYLSKIDRELLIQKYALYRSIFANEEKQENIRASKEEQYQEGFIRDLFCSVLGYTIKPEANYNILTELKNETADKNNAKKSDGAIVLNGEVKAVIELKGTDTTDLNHVAFQAFSYKNHHENCPYVIVSNFERLRLYVETQIDYEEFNLFSLSKERFDELYLLLAMPQINTDIPLKLKHETLTEEKEITNNFYADYSTFKRCLFEDLCERNPESEKLLLFKKTQKLLDRILFILFCEDRNLLPTNTTLGIINDWKALRKMGYPQPLYNLFKTFFERINTGFINEEDHSRDVFAYNGGLFKTDTVLDSITVGDDVLYIHAQRLANYDFESQISVDILGRIFENSLTEIEEIEEEIRNEKTSVTEPNSKPSNLGKRKKDGVFYTPAYITKYIVENTIGQLCAQKREELGINDTEFAPVQGKGKAANTKTTELEKRLESYRSWLLSLKILDPACGSGAFLNAALKQLRQEHTLIDYYWSRIRKGELNFSEIDNTILENNLYGVDINEESVEIAKLSLWLSTAKKNRKLSTLANNIKCGNSLISDKTIAGEKAFDWQKEFPELFAANLSCENGEKPFSKSSLSQENDQKTFSKSPLSQENDQKPFSESSLSQENDQKLFNESSLPQENDQKLFNGGFDVVIGNPPYVSVNNIKDTNAKDYYKSHYKTANEMFDLYSIFTEKASSLLKPNGLFGFIFSNSWLGIKSFSSFREFLAKDVTVTRLVQLPEKVFADATVKTIICIYTNKKPNEDSEIEIEKCEDSKFISKGFTLPYKTIFSTHGYNFTLEKNIELSKVPTVKLGEIMKASCGIKSANDKKFILSEKIDDACYPLIRGRNVKRWEKPVNVGEYIWYKPELMTENVNARPRDLAFFTVPQKILIQEIAQEINATLETEQFLCNDTLNVIYGLKENYDMKFILLLLNSNLINFWFKQIYPSGLHVKVNQLEQIPVPAISPDEQKPFVELADKMLSLNGEMQKKSAKFLSRVRDNLKVNKISVSLESFYALSFSEFVKELGKQKVKLSLKEQDEWEEYFDEYKAEISALKADIDKTDKAINTAVYELYGLTAEEIAAVEENSNAKS